MEDIVEHIGRGLLGFFRLLLTALWTSIEWTYYKPLWWLGWPITRILTFGAYPKESFFESERASPWTHFIVVLAALSFTFSATYFLAQRFGA